MRSKIKQKQEMNYKSLAYALLLLNIVLIGAVFNLLVISRNGGKMPFYTKIQFAEDNTSIPFSDFNEVEIPLFADILNIKSSSKIMYFSIGDVLMVISAILLILLLIYEIKLAIKEKWKLMRGFNEK